jgi:hypothetical protein
LADTNDKTQLTAAFQLPLRPDVEKHLTNSEFRFGKTNILSEMAGVLISLVLSCLKKHRTTVLEA